MAINTALGALVTLLFVKLGLPRLLSRAEIWMGGAIGRFMQNLAKKAEEEGEGDEESPGGGGGGSFNIGGFKVNAGTIQAIAEILKVVQSLGFLKGGGGGGENPFLKP